MTTALLIIHIVLAIAMAGVILIQKTDGSGSAFGGGTMGGLMTARGTANFLTHTTAFLAVLFFLSTLLLALVFKGSNNKKSILDHDHGARPVSSKGSVPSQPQKTQAQQTPSSSVNQPEKSKP